MMIASGVAAGLSQRIGGKILLIPGLVLFAAGAVYHVERVAHAVCTHGFVDAMRPTLTLPISVVVLPAVSCFAVRRPRRGESQGRPEEAVA